MIPSELYGNYRNRKFSDIFPDAETFVGLYKASGLYNDYLVDNDLFTLYYLLYARYGNSTIASSDENQFQYKTWTVIWQYAPAWKKNVEIQNNLRTLSETELLTGSRQIMNHAQNPATLPTTESTTELDYIDEQSTALNKKSKIDAYANLMSILKKDVTDEFLGKFKKLFLAIVEPELPLWYITDEGGAN